MVKKISILGSTGSVGRQALDIVRRHRDQFRVIGLAAGSNTDLVRKQIDEFSPVVVSVSDGTKARDLKGGLGGSKTEILEGAEGAMRIAALHENDFVLSAIVGAAGLLPTMAAIEKGKVVGLANKESMVIAGELMHAKSKEAGAVIVPVDSEHSALFQCLQGNRRSDVERLVLTASGGPFRNTAVEDFGSITRKQALNHPNWDMGDKITIDSATMMNKGLEVMEARWLFGLEVARIQVLVHPQSIVHSMVGFVDGSSIAQLGEPDMRVPIAYALSYPERISTGVKPLDLAEIGRLEFFPPDLKKFHCLRMAFDVAIREKTYPAVLNAANEVAVQAFLQEKISFVRIPEIVDKALQAHDPKSINVLEDVLEADRWARELSLAAINS